MKSTKDVGGTESLGIAGSRLAAGRGGPARGRAAFGELAIANAKLSRQVEALEQSNARLAELAGSVSHDLIEGLATIALFVDALASRLGDELDPEARRDLEGIRAGVDRMDLLVSEELRSARAGARPVPVDAGAALGTALANLEARIAQADPEIVAERLPWVACDRTDLTRLFQNLLANSLAARDPGHDLRISVSAHRSGMRWRFEVADSGVGIPPDVVEGMVGPAASGPDPHRGHGIAICRRIVSAYGGTIRAARRTDGGTTVSFDLPADNRPGPGRGGRVRLAPA